MLNRPSDEAFLALATPQQQIDAVISFVTRHRETSLVTGKSLEGHPYDYAWVGSTLVVAGLVPGGTTKVSTYKRRELLRWYRLAARFLRENEGYDIESAFYETDVEALQSPAARAEARAKAKAKSAVQRERREQLRQELRQRQH